MYVAISVGHRICVGIIPTQQVDASELRGVFTGIVQRFKHLVEGRTDKFHVTLMGNKINMGINLSEKSQAVATVMVNAIRFAEFKNLEHVTFHLIGDLDHYVDETMAYITDKFNNMDGPTIPGVATEYHREMIRLTNLKERIMHGIENPENIW